MLVCGWYVGPWTFLLQRRRGRRRNECKSGQNLLQKKTCRSLIFHTFTHRQNTYICYHRHPKTLQEYNPEIPDILQFCFYRIRTWEHLWFNYTWNEGAQLVIAIFPSINPNLCFYHRWIKRRRFVNYYLFVWISCFISLKKKNPLSKGWQIYTLFWFDQIFEIWQFLAGNCGWG